MKRNLFCVLCFALLAVLAYASDGWTEAVGAPLREDWEQLTDLMHRADAKTLSVISMIICQASFLLCRTILGKILGVYQLLVLAVLSVGVSIGTNLLAGKSWLESLLGDASTLMAYQVLIHQCHKQWSKREEDQNECE